MSYFSKDSRFESQRSSNYTGPGGQRKKPRFQTKRAHMERLSKLDQKEAKFIIRLFSNSALRKHYKDLLNQDSKFKKVRSKSHSEIKEKEKIYSSIVKQIKYPESLPQNSKIPKGERSSHLFLNFASSRNSELLVHKPKHTTLGPGSYQDSERQYNKLRESSDFSIRGREQFKQSIERELRTESSQRSSRANFTLRTLDRHSYMNISLSNVKTNSDIKSYSLRDRFSGFLPSSAKKRQSTDLTHSIGDRGTVESRLLLEPNFQTEKAGTRKEINTSMEIGTATNEELDQFL